mmetsp:Transcript_4921/g.31489  ORF Transcript_4921/g.31489 Transcript_4921/m.31489 type:complete len:125 (-) Transcript_4921:1536-1910(-)
MQQKIPGLEVVGTTFPPEPWKVKVSKVVSALQFGVIALALAGDTIFSTLNFPPPLFYTMYIKPNKIQSCLLAWVIGNLVGGSMMSTGAFEIFYDEKLLFSKLSTGRLPDMRMVEEISRKIQELR